VCARAHEHGKNYDQFTDRHGMATLRPAKILRIRCPSDEAERAFDHLIDDVVDECDKLPAQRLFVGSHERDVNP